MKLTAQEEYGLRCLLQVARQAPDPRATPVSIRAVAEAEGLSVEYAAKLLRVLRQAGFVESVRGAAGGYTLACPPGETSAFSVLEALDGPLYTESFCTGHSGQLESCVHSTGCSIRVLWKWVDVALRSVLQRVTLADLLLEADPVAEKAAAAASAPKNSPQSPLEAQPRAGEPRNPLHNTPNPQDEAAPAPALGEPR